MDQAPTSEKTKQAFEKPKTHNKLLIPFIIVLILAIAGVGFAAYNLFIERKITEDQPIIVEDEISFTPIAKEYETVKNYIMTELIPYGVFVSDCEATVGDMSDTALLLPKMCFSGDYEKSDSELKEKLTTDGFREIEAEHLGSAGPNIKAYKNEKNGIICSVVYKEEFEKAYISSDQKARISCAHENWVWITEEDVALINQLSEAFTEKTGKKISIADTKNLSQYIKNSPNTPYQTLTVLGNGFMMAFYRASEDDEWIYSETISGQGATPCDELNEEEMAAFTSEWCYDE